MTDYEKNMLVSHSFLIKEEYYIDLTQGLKAIVDKEDFDKLNKYKWYACNSRGSFYATREANNKSIKMHRLIVNALPGQIIDHINGNTLDNRKCNLRVVNFLQNASNCKKRKDGLTSKYKGVNKRNGKYRAYIQFNKKNIHIGTFQTEEQAALEYNKKAIDLFGEYARLNDVVIKKGDQNENK
jgi:hypothetical protein